MGRVRIFACRSGATVEEIAPDAGLLEAAQVRIGMGRRLEVVSPVGDRCDPRVQGLQGAPQSSGVDIVCAVFGRDPSEHRRPIASSCYLRGEPADRSLPHVAVSVDKARNDEPTPCLNHFDV